MFEVLQITHKEKWKSYVKQCEEYDFYHTWDYHKLSKDNKEGEPELIVMKGDSYLILLPLLKREIIDASGKHRGFDYTSCYGYVGPVYKGTITPNIIIEFTQLLKSYCNTNRIVSIFSRLHPTIKQEFLLREIGEVENNSTTIQIDLRQPLEEQRKHYRKSNKSEINKLRKTSKIIWSEHSRDDINEFIEIYEETMFRVNAESRYFFNNEYYINLLNSDDYKTQLVFVEIDNFRIAGALFIFSKNIIQYHLAGTRTAFMKITPMKLLIDEIRIYGTKNGYKSFHLGGGTSSSDEDPLFRFKRGFSKIECEFNTFKYIFNKEVYDSLTKEIVSDKEKKESDFFPLYRA